MPTATKIQLTRSGSNKNFAKNYAKWEASEAPLNLVNGDNYFQLDADIAGFELAYLYIVTDIDVDVDFEIARSAGVQTLDPDFSVPIPGGTSTLPAADKVADFSISLFGGDTLWLKVSAAAFIPPNNTITQLFLMIKR